VTVREAAAGDVPVLVRHRRAMVSEIAAARGAPLDDADLDVMDVSYADYVAGRIADGSVRAWVVEDGGHVVCSAAASILPWPPGAGDTAERKVALLHSLYTDEPSRRRGCARAVAEAAVDSCRADGCRWISLGFSEVAKPLYESLGFRPDTGVMKLILR